MYVCACMLMASNLAHDETLFRLSIRGVCSFSVLFTVGMFNAVNSPNAVTNLTVLLTNTTIVVCLSRTHVSVNCLKKTKNSSTIIKAMYFRFIVLLIVAQTRVYTNTDNFLSNFLLSFIYCKRAGWKYSPLMAKWERGSKVREEEGQQVVWWRLYKAQWDRTGAQK